MVAILVALVLIALVVTAVICMLRKPALPAQGNARTGMARVVMTGGGSTDDNLRSKHLPRHAAKPCIMHRDKAVRRPRRE